MAKRRNKTRVKKEKGMTANDIAMTIITLGSIGYLFLVKLWTSL